MSASSRAGGPDGRPHGAARHDPRQDPRPARRRRGPAPDDRVQRDPRRLCRQARELEGLMGDLTVLLDTILAKIPAPPGDAEGPLQMIVCNATHDDYVGKLASWRA